jgi:hypothetical protein
MVWAGQSAPVNPPDIPAVATSLADRLVAILRQADIL